MMMQYLHVFCCATICEASKISRHLSFVAKQKKKQNKQAMCVINIIFFFISVSFEHFFLTRILPRFDAAVVMYCKGLKNKSK